MASDPKPVNSVKTYEVDPKGDLYLEHKDARLLVSSKALSLASPVFSTMLNSRFREGMANHQGIDKPTISLTNDDEESMRIICGVIHHNFDMVPNKITVYCLLDLAKLGDKYDCMAALRGYVTMCLYGIDFVEGVRREEVDGYLLVAYLFDILEAFNLASIALIIRPASPIMQHDLVTKNLAGEHRSLARAFLLITEQWSSKHGS